MRRAANLSNFLAGAAIPLSIWGLVSSLLLHLIELRSVFIAGGENRLRIAALAFAGGVILTQRLARLQGPSLARPYAWGLGAAITLFLAHSAWAYRLPAHPALVFAVNEALFLLLMWACFRITSACSVDSEPALETAAESGILPRLRVPWRRTPTKIEGSEVPTAPEEQWAEKLPAAHPGRVLLYFSLVALPAFGAGAYFFGADADASARMGGLLFVYLWCAFALLFLSSLRQLAAYFEKREVTLPEGVGLAWLSIGFAAATLVLVAAFFLPQPPSVASMFVRDQMVAAYRGWEAERGIPDSVGRGPAARQADDAGPGRAPEPNNPGTEAEAEAFIRDRNAESDKLGDAYAAEFEKRGIGGAKAVRDNYARMRGRMNERFGKAFQAVFKLLLVVAVIAGAVILYMAIVSFARGVRDRLGFLRWRRSRREEDPKKKRKKKRAAGAPAPAHFREFRNPFAAGRGDLDGNEIARYLWSALLAYCEDCGSPCAPDQTPREFLATRPAPLEGFEDDARQMADLFVYSEFSGRELGEKDFEFMKKFWIALEALALRAAA